MKFKTVLFKVPAALFVASVFFTPVGLPSIAEASPKMAGCAQMPSVTPLVSSIFGPYAWSGGGSTNTPGTGALRDLVPTGVFITNCVFAREYDSVRQSIPTGSEVLSTGHVILPSDDARLQTWNRLRSRLGLTVLNQPPYHYGVRPGMAIGYRDGEDIIAFALWLTRGGRLQQNVAGTGLRPIVNEQIR